MSSLKSTLQYLKFFYSYLKHRIFISILLNGLVGLFDGFGLAMFLPLLQMATGNGVKEAESLGALEFIPKLIESLGLSFTVPTILVVMCVFFILKGFAKLGSESYRVSLIEFFTRSVRLELISNLSSIKFKSFVLSDVGKIQNTLSGEVGAVVNAATAFFQVIQQLVLVGVYVGFAILLDAQFALLVVAGALLSNLLYRQVYKKTRGASYNVTRLLHQLQGYLIQFTANYKYLKATGTLNKYDERLKKVAIEVEEENKKIGMLNAILISLKEPILVGVVSFVIYLQNAIFGRALGPILTSLLFFYRSLTALIAIQNHWNKFVARTGSMDNMIEFGLYLKEHQEIPGSLSMERFKEKLALRSLCFYYGKEIILKNIDLEIYKNETIAFVGESGSGKTTLVNVLAGLMPPDEGLYAIDGIDTKELKMSSFQSRIGYITQEPVIFSDTIFNNVTFWAEHSEENLQKFNKALEKAAIKSLIQSLPERENTLLGNNGINLSGGQKQRISIARELFKDIDILIMDEATSALDSETEYSIQRNIDALRGNYTILIVAHRLSTIRKADRIILLDKGCILDIGDFDTLKKNSDRFQSMVELQDFK